MVVAGTVAVTVKVVVETDSDVVAVQPEVAGEAGHDEITDTVTVRVGQVPVGGGPVVVGDWPLVLPGGGSKQLQALLTRETVDLGPQFET